MLGGVQVQTPPYDADLQFPCRYNSTDIMYQRLFPKGESGSRSEGSGDNSRVRNKTDTEQAN